MGRARRKKEEEAAALVLLGMERGIRAGRKKALEDALELAARKLFADEAEMVLALLEEGTPEEVMDALPRLRREVTEPRWREVVRPLLSGVVAAQVSR